MHIKFMNSKGSALAAVDYVYHKSRNGEHVKILRGDPHLTVMIAESLSFKHQYRSSVIGWHEDDKPSPAQINEVLDEFEHLAFAGLDYSQYNMLAVQHTKSDGTPHIHIIVQIGRAHV